MRIAEVLERRRQGWLELESMCDALQNARFPYRDQGSQLARFSSLYRAACTDLSMAEQYQLPPTTVEYLHRLVGRAHSQLYRSQRLPFERWYQYLTLVIPHAVFRDPCVIVAGLVFFGTFALSALLAFSESTFPTYPQRVLGIEQLESFEQMYDKPIDGGNHRHYLQASGWYIKHNAGIGLQCFALGPLLLPSLCMLGYNGVVLGATFGYMARPDVHQGDNFMQFVTAHGAFELTAIALAAGAGLRVGVGLFSTGGLSRMESFRLNAERAIPIILCSVILFVLAAFTEGCLSPSGAGYLIKASFAIFSSTLLVLYFVMLGMPTDQRLARLEVCEDNPWRTRSDAAR
jgi:uncharacterized membrane protein SpoIIM required for sporulation